jgi:hypothetical protein
MPIRATFGPLPANGGSAITSVQYRIGTGTPIAFPSATPGTYDTVALPGDNIQIRAGNAVGFGPWSDTKSISVGEPEILLNPSFADATTWAGTVPETAFTITGGQLNITNRGLTFDDGVFQNVAFLAGRSYDVSVTVVGTPVNGGGRIKIDTTDIPGLTPLTVAGTYTAVYTSPSAATRKFIVSVSQPTATASFSEVSLKLRPL